ncbi:MAG: Stk1 family PASTA domain-containing Ser/Thr kinase [Oscillospiraceae bacterium]|jgi:serine/threonine-protein kinase|nr:Stk1 family PASTA domain-containing Ser/Thr kinase [Oscillospiraceae bacterium]
MDSYVGKRLDGRYEIQEIIGVGGMAVVYKAYDNIDDRIVAVKILKEEFLANEEFRRRFKNESKAIAVLSHPNIVKVYDVSFGDKLQYIVMEHIEGITLKEYIEQQKIINWKEAVHFFFFFLRALQHAHDKGIVHRDIKPQNIMLLQNGNIKVTDFGIARFSRGDTRTMTESAIGSVHYISPEQARGEITDDKADIYSVGVVLYEMITGTLPFESDSAVSVAIMQLQAEAKNPREINASIPLGLEQITMRAMQKNTKDRYQSAAEMLLDLDEFKRNPSIKFNYAFFVDKQPTKFLSNTGPVFASGAVNTAADIESTDEKDEEEDRKKTVPILVGILSALVVVLFIVIGVLYFFTDIFTAEKIPVPDFLGMYYEDEIKDNTEYDDFEFDVTYVSSTSYKAGQVSKQSPYAGAKIRVGSTIKLEVVTEGTTKTIPMIYGLDLGVAKQRLSAEGFTNIKTIEQYDENMEPGVVIRSTPAEGQSANVTETITLIVSTDVNENLVTVPNVVGTKQAEAKEFLESVDLKVGKITEQDSSLEKGVVISQSVDNPQKVTKGTSIDLVISSGNPSVGTATISLTLPSDGNNNGLFQVYMNNELVNSKNVLLGGSSYSFTLSGTGSNNSVTVYIEKIKVYECIVDFTKSPAVIRNIKTYDYSASTSREVPNVERMSEKDALAALKAAGFTNVTVSRIVSSADNEGKVISQSPQNPASRKPNDRITITVGRGFGN